MHLHIPKMKLKLQNCPKWFNSEIRHHMKCLRTLRRKCHCHPTPHNLTKLNLYEPDLQKRIIAAKTSFEMNLIQNFSQRNNSKIFKYISSVSGHGSIPPTINLGSSTATSDFEKATLFNTYFYSVFINSSFLLPQMDMLPLPQSILR